jgi:hypothetical protein
MPAFATLFLAVSGAATGAVSDEIAEVVLSKLIANSAADSVLCVKVNNGDPSKSLLSRLKRVDRTVVPDSECHYSNTNHPNDYHMSSGRPAHFLGVSDLFRESDSAAEVKATDHYNTLGAELYTVRLIRDAAGWKITSFHLDATA